MTPPVMVFAYNHPSQKAAVYAERLLEQKAGLIENLKHHPQYEIFILGKHLCRVSLDMVYYDKRLKKYIYEDVKGFDNALSKLKRKLLHITHGIEVKIIK